MGPVFCWVTLSQHPVSEDAVPLMSDEAAFGTHHPQFRSCLCRSVEEEATRIQQERLTAEEENRNLREAVFDSQARARSAEAALKKVQSEAADRDKQLRIMTDQNAELLRLLEQEEAQTSQLSEAKEVMGAPG